MKYHKIYNVFARDPNTNYKTLITGEWARPEFGLLAGSAWHVHEKVDGTNIRVIWDGETVTLAGKSDKAQIPTFLVERLKELFPAELLAETLEGPLVLYGEGYGGRIQKVGPLYGEVDFCLFDAWHPSGIWLTQDAVDGLAESLQITRAPKVMVSNLHSAIEYAATSFQSALGNLSAEGLICRPFFELSDRMGRRIITKIKTKDFVSDVENE